MKRYRNAYKLKVNHLKDDRAFILSTLGDTVNLPLTKGKRKISDLPLYRYLTVS